MLYSNIYLFARLNHPIAPLQVFQGLVLKNRFEVSAFVSTGGLNSFIDGSKFRMKAAA
jgi:hypothetical protein